MIIPINYLPFNFNFELTPKRLNQNTTVTPNFPFFFASFNTLNTSWTVHINTDGVIIFKKQRISKKLIKTWELWLFMLTDIHISNLPHQQSTSARLLSTSASLSVRQLGLQEAIRWLLVCQKLATKAKSMYKQRTSLCDLYLISFCNIQSIISFSLFFSLSLSLPFSAILSYFALLLRFIVQC